MKKFIYRHKFKLAILIIATLDIWYFYNLDFKKFLEMWSFIEEHKYTLIYKQILEDKFFSVITLLLLLANLLFFKLTSKFFSSYIEKTFSITKSKIKQVIPNFLKKMEHNILSEDEFQGQQHYLTEIGQRLVAEKGEKQKLLNIYGYSGSGKSQLVFQYAARDCRKFSLFRQYKRGILYFDLQEYDDIFSLQKEIIRWFYDVAPLVKDPEEAEYKVNEILNNWYDKNGWALIIIDNPQYQKSNEIKKYLEKCFYLPRKNKIIEISQEKGEHQDDIEIKIKDENGEYYQSAIETGEAILKRFIGELFDKRPEQSKEICRLVGYLPLAVESCGFYIRDYKIDISDPEKAKEKKLEKILYDLKNNKKFLKSKALADDRRSVRKGTTHDKNVLSTLALTFNSSVSDNQLLAKLAFFFGVLDHKPIRSDVLYNFFLSDWFDDEQKMREAIDKLFFIKSSDTGEHIFYSTHRLWYEFLLFPYEYLNDAENTMNIRALTKESQELFVSKLLDEAKISKSDNESKEQDILTKKEPIINQLRQLKELSAQEKLLIKLDKRQIETLDRFLLELVWAKEMRNDKSQDEIYYLSFFEATHPIKMSYDNNIFNLPLIEKNTKHYLHELFENIPLLKTLKENFLIATDINNNEIILRYPESVHQFIFEKFLQKDESEQAKIVNSILTNMTFDKIPYKWYWNMEQVVHDNKDDVRQIIHMGKIFVDKWRLDKTIPTADLKKQENFFFKLGTVAFIIYKNKLINEYENEFSHQKDILELSYKAFKIVSKIKSVLEFQIGVDGDIEEQSAFLINYFNTLLFLTRYELSAEKIAEEIKTKILEKINTKDRLYDEHAGDLYSILASSYLHSSTYKSSLESPASIDVLLVSHKGKRWRRNIDIKVGDTIYFQIHYYANGMDVYNVKLKMDDLRDIEFKGKKIVTAAASGDLVDTLNDAVCINAEGRVKLVYQKAALFLDGQSIPFVAGSDTKIFSGYKAGDVVRGSYGNLVAKFYVDSAETNSDVSTKHIHPQNGAFDRERILKELKQQEEKKIRHLKSAIDFYKKAEKKLRKSLAEKENAGNLSNFESHDAHHNPETRYYLIDWGGIYKKAEKSLPKKEGAANVSNLDDLYKIFYKLRKAYFELGMIYKKKEKYGMAIKYLKKAVKIDERVPNNDSDIYYELGVVYARYSLEVQDPKRADEYIEKAVNLLEKTKDIEEKYGKVSIRTIKDLGVTYRMRGKSQDDYERAVKYIKQVKSLEEKRDNISMGGDISEYDISVSELNIAYQKLLTTLEHDGIELEKLERLLIEYKNFVFNNLVEEEHPGSYRIARRDIPTIINFLKKGVGLRVLSLLDEVFYYEETEITDALFIFDFYVRIDKELSRLKIHLGDLSGLEIEDQETIKGFIEAKNMPRQDIAINLKTTKKCKLVWSGSCLSLNKCQSIDCCKATGARSTYALNLPNGFWVNAMFFYKVEIIE